jgi:hypothetical protein
VLKVFVTGLAGVFVASVAMAQPPRQNAPKEQMQARYNIFVMEGVLERAVEHGAQNLSRQVRAIMPDMLLLSGAAQARGFRLDGYGVFFDVEVPAMRRSVAWTLRAMIDQNGVAATTALQQLKAHIESIQDPRDKANLQQAIKRIELQVGPMQPIAPGLALGAPPRGTVSAQTVQGPDVAQAQPVAAPPTTTAADLAFVADPSESYTAEVKSALIDAMLDHSGPIGVGSDEWLTVAARDNERVPGDPYDVTTIMLRVKGSDLAAFRAERITKEEARKRVEVREF